jgi:ABC-type multidrug transport system permease subunit
MALLFIGRGLADDIWEERQRGTLRRLAVSPASLAGFLTGRLLFAAIIFLTVSLAALTAVRYVMGAQIVNMPGAALWLVFSGLVFFVALLFVAMCARSPRAADIFGNLLVFPLVLIGGSFFPFEMMPDWMAAIGRLTPNGWALTQLRDIVQGAVRPGSLATGAAAMAAAGTLIFMLALRRLRRGFLV